MIVTYYNNGCFLDELINSYNELKLELEHELIIVDDGSDQLDYLDRNFGGDDIKIIKLNENQGVQHARNRGLLESKYKYTIIIDGDDKFSGESDLFIRDAVSILDNNPKVAFVHGLAYMFEGASGYTISSYPLTPEFVARMHHVPTSIVYRTTDAIAAKGYNTEICKWQDWAFGVALLDYKMRELKDVSIGFIPLKVILYRTSNNPKRISQKEVDLEQVVKLVVDSHRTFFAKYYSCNDIYLSVIKSKPSRLIELINIARYDYNLAVKVIEERGYDVNHDKNKDWIP